MFYETDTYSDESMKYIPRAPMLSAKTNTTWGEQRRKGNYFYALSGKGQVNKVFSWGEHNMQH